MHNKDLESQRNKILLALDLSLQDLFSQKSNNATYSPGYGRDTIQTEIQEQIGIVQNAENLVREWATNLDIYYQIIFKR